MLPGLIQLPAIAEENPPSPERLTGEVLDDVRTPGDPVHGLEDVDVRAAVAPVAGALDAVSDLGAMSSVRWNDFGTPASLLPADGSLGAAPGAPADGARAWLRDHAAAFGLSAGQVDGLELVSAQPFAQSGARAVLFRQTYGDLPAASGGLVTVGVADGKVAYVSSSIVPGSGTPPEASLSALEGFLKAAADVGRPVAAGDVSTIDARDAQGWTRLQVPGLAQEQMVRPRALGMTDGSVRRVWEVNVIDNDPGKSHALAHTVLVDAVSGEVLVRRNAVQNSEGVESFTGAFTATECGPKHPFELTDDNTRSIALTGLSSPADDITIKLFDPAGRLLGTYDLLTSPETGTYTANRIPGGTYTAQVCPFDDASAVSGQYQLTVVTSDQAASTGETQANPSWRYFLANPTLDGPQRTPTNSVIGCWLRGEARCDDPPGILDNVQATAPWDATFSGVPTFTTIGNNANTHEAWASPLTPGGTAQAPYSPTRDYTEEFTDAWNNEECNPAELTPGGNDINASVGNLFVAHNRMHDYSYYLGFNEQNYNMQSENGGRGGVAGDPEIGNAQAGALTGGQPSFLGRDNANQITLQDGTPGITNQYLFQPIAGAFYAPCTDGGLDMGIVGHEYTHAISNRMVAGPDEGLTSEQGRAMGESWSDLVAAEYHFAHGYSNGGNVWAVGVYATGNREVAIRDYSINRNPLNYSDYGFDTTGAEVHSDGEIWNGTQYAVRQALVKKWNRRFPAGNRLQQERCAQASPRKSPVPARYCPGNRRWIQLMFDSFLLQQGATSMLDARDAMIAADRMRFRGRNEKVLWDAYARRGMGAKASTPSADSEDVKASFASPTARNGRITFRAPKGGQLFVGAYEARVTPVADTIRRTKLGQRVSFTPGRYQMLFTSPRHAAKRFTVKVSRGERDRVRVRAARNLAAGKNGAKVIGASADSRNTAFLIDGTESTNWGGVNADGTTNVDEQSPFVSVDLAGKRASTVRRVNVSAYLRPAEGGSDPVPLAQVDEDPDSGSRFTALRRFALERCMSRCGSDGARWKRFYTSRADAFPAKRPRPVAPDLNLRTFDVPDVRARALRLVAVENQCTGFAGYAGEQDADPINDTDCKTASDRGTIVHAAELQVW